MRKVKFLQILLLVIMLLAFILLTGEIFGELRPLLVQIYGITMWAALFGNAVCAVILYVNRKKKH